MTTKSHLTLALRALQGVRWAGEPEGLEQIRLIKSGMNTGRENN